MIEEVDAEPYDAVVHDPRPGSLLRGRLWHPDPATLSGEDARRTLVDIGRLRSVLGALEALAVERIRTVFEAEARLAVERQRGPQRFDGALAHQLAVAEVALAEGISEHAAARLINASQQLCGPQIAALESLESGVLPEAHARVLTEEVATLPESTAEAFGVLALGKLETRKGRRRTAAEFRRAVRELRERMHPESIRARRVRAAGDRSVTFKPEPDGMCTVSAFLPAEQGLAAFSRLDHLARSQREAEPDDPRTLPQLRADALAGLVLGNADEDGTAAVPHSVMSKAEIVVLVPVEALLGASDEPATLEGYGPIDAETARELAAAAPSWERLLVDGDRVPLSLGRSAYRPPKKLRSFIKYRDGTCQFPGCTARHCEIDHMVEWQDGGKTDGVNLQSLCPKHHAIKSVGGWSCQRLPSHAGEPDEAGVEDIVWVSPLGGRAVSGPLERGEAPPPF